MRDDPALYGIGPKGAWVTLRTLHTITAGEGWTRYVAAEDRARGRHVLDTTPPPHEPSYRLLHRAGVGYYGRGLAAGHGHPGALDALLSERAPKHLAADEAAGRLGISTHGVRYLFRADQLYPVYVVSPEDGRVRRYAFADQVAAISKRRAGRTVPAGEKWQDLRAQLPDLARLDTISEHVPTAPSSSPLPVDPRLPTPVRQREALAVGHDAGWFVFRQQRGDGVAFTLELPGGVVVVLPARAVEPWLLGFGDARGEAA